MRIYIVQKDDTLYKIAKKHHIPVEKIIKLNPHIADPDYIVPGMKIKLPHQEDYKSDTGKVMRKTEREQELTARTNERRPLGPVTEMDDRGAWEMHNRVPLKKREHSLGRSQNKSVEGQSHKQYKHNDEKRRTTNQHMKTYSNRQYVPLRENQRKQTQMQQPDTMPYIDRQRQMDNRYMYNNQMMMPPAHPEQPYYCPCCMYYWQMQQSMMYHYNENERSNHPQRRYY